MFKIKAITAALNPHQSAQRIEDAVAGKFRLFQGSDADGGMHTFLTTDEDEFCLECTLSA
jgi:hypothetical protein